MNSEFEERQFEWHFNAQLTDDQQLVYVPGLVGVGRLGVDVAMHTRNPRFHRLFLPTIPDGVFIDLLWRDIQTYRGEFPRFRANVFLQHKRPEFLTRPNSAQWHYWHREYYRYRITEHQQRTLLDLESRVGNDAVVVYSCPAFHTFHELWTHISNGDLLDNFNYAQPSVIADHAAYTFVQPGTTGWANPKGELVTSYDPRERLRTIKNRPQTAGDPVEFLLATAGAVSVTWLEPVTARAYNQIVRAISETGAGENPLHQIVAFSYVMNLSWLVATL